jgi:hypothetical protein
LSQEEITKIRELQAAKALAEEKLKNADLSLSYYVEVCVLKRGIQGEVNIDFSTGIIHRQ